MHDWTWIIFLGVLLLAFLLMKRRGQIDAVQAREFLRDGAMLIDVRTPGEFSSAHLPHAINIPLDQVGAAVPRRVPQKDQVILLHCQSGMRSAAAQRQLRSLGYSRAFNLGSYSRAAHIVKQG